MRLIDKDALIDEIKHTLWDWESVDGIKSSTVLKQTISDINNMPTIDAEPIRHGKLLRTEAYPHRLYCSECFKTLIPNEEICFEKNEFPKYCMYCGARVDEE